MPYIIAFPELLDSSEELRDLFCHELRYYRNVWLLNCRNTGRSDHHESMDPEDMARDVIRFMNKNKITTASLLGHGFGGKVAALTGILHYNRVTSVCMLDYSPMDLHMNTAWQALEHLIEVCASLNLTGKKDIGEVEKLISKVLPLNAQSRKMLRDNIYVKDGSLTFRSNMKALAQSITAKDHTQNLSKWPMIGLYPGRTLALYAERSEYVHQSTNTLPLYNKFPMLYGQYGNFLDHLNTGNHWMHQDKDLKDHLQRRLTSFYKWYDGVHPHLRDRSEVGSGLVRARSEAHMSPQDKEMKLLSGDPVMNQYIPYHKHHNWFYEKQEA